MQGILSSAIKALATRAAGGKAQGGEAAGGKAQGGEAAGGKAQGGSRRFEGRRVCPPCRAADLVRYAA